MIERYQSGSSYLHRMDARIKLIVALLLIIGIVITPDDAFAAYPLLWSVVASLILLGEVGLWRLSRLAMLGFPFALAAVTLTFTTPGDSLLQIGQFSITDAGSIRFAAILVKSWLAVQVALLLSMTTHPTDLLWALHWLRVPAVLVQIIQFMYRYLFTLREEAERLSRARTARSGSLPGHAAGGSLLWRAQVAGHMIGSLFVRSYERSERIYAAMLARGYDGDLRVLNAPPITLRAVAVGAVPLLPLIVIQLMVRL
jgi:cobalt/nickel transport system permease protein